MSDWHTTGDVLIACNCDWGCPCNVNARPTHGDCEGGWVWSITDGAVGEVDISGLSVAVFADWPGAIHKGGGVAAGYVDDDADETRTAALVGLVRGDIGGPWAIFATTYQLQGPHRARFEVSADGYRSRCDIAGVAELAIEPIHNPVTGAEAHPELLLPEGMVLKRATLAASRVFRVDDGVRYDHSGRYAAFGRFHYRG
jgi:hypothetical protein